MNGGRKPEALALYWCELPIICGREWEREEGEEEAEEEEEADGEEEGGGVGAGGRGVSLMMGELLLWEDLVRVACMGVMKLDWEWGCGALGGVGEEGTGEGEPGTRGGCWGLLGLRWDGCEFTRAG